MKAPLVSVVIPNYNRTSELERAIKSALNQSYQLIEILIVDDASEIKPDEVILTFKDDRIKLFQLETNSGAANARNVGGSKALGEYIAFLDSDDEWLPDYLERRISMICAFNPGGIYGGCLKKTNNSDSFKPPVRSLNKGEAMVNYLLSGTLRAVTSSIFVKREYFTQTLFDHNFVPHEDYVFCIEFSNKYDFICDKEVGTIYHATGNSLSQNIGGQSIKFLNEYKEGLEFKWLYYFILRKTFHAIKMKQDYLIPKYYEILKHEKSQSSMALRNVPITAYKLSPKLLSRLFNILIEGAYSVKKMIS